MSRREDHSSQKLVTGIFICFFIIVAALAVSKAHLEKVGSIENPIPACEARCTPFPLIKYEAPNCICAEKILVRKK